MGHETVRGGEPLMEMKPISFEDALALYDEEPTGEATAQSIENPSEVYEGE